MLYFNTQGIYPKEKMIDACQDVLSKDNYLCIILKYVFRISTISNKIVMLDLFKKIPF